MEDLLEEELEETDEANVNTTTTSQGTVSGRKRKVDLSDLRNRATIKKRRGKGSVGPSARERLDLYVEMFDLCCTQQGVEKVTMSEADRHFFRATPNPIVMCLRHHFNNDKIKFEEK